MKLTRWKGGRQGKKGSEAGEGRKGKKWERNGKEEWKETGSEERRWQKKEGGKAMEGDKGSIYYLDIPGVISRRPLQLYEL